MKWSESHRKIIHSAAVLLTALGFASGDAEAGWVFIDDQFDRHCYEPRLSHQSECGHRRRLSSRPIESTKLCRLHPPRLATSMATCCPGLETPPPPTISFSLSTWATATTLTRAAAPMRCSIHAPQVRQLHAAGDTSDWKLLGLFGRVGFDGRIESNRTSAWEKYPGAFDVGPAGRGIARAFLACVVDPALGRAASSEFRADPRLTPRNGLHVGDAAAICATILVPKPTWMR